MKFTALTLLICLVAPLACLANDGTVAFTVDAAKDVKPISRYIYGVNRKIEGDWSGATLVRVGGNRYTAYNWTNNASNAGNDWHYQNDGFLGGGDAPGGAVLPAIQNAADHHAALLLTIPIGPYVAADKNGGGDIRRANADYIATRLRQNLPQKTAAFSPTPDLKAPAVYEDEFVNWVKSQRAGGRADARAPVFFSLDNEPDLWSSTHAETHPQPLTYTEIVRRTLEFSRAIKRVMPQAKIFGPASYGWQGFVDLQHAPDAQGRDFLEFYLAQMAGAQKQDHQRLLDVLDVHWYPEATGGGKRIVGNSGPAVVAARLQAPRSLWDPTYTEESWIAQWQTRGPIELLPRLLGKIERDDPGTLLSISEYNFGGGADISGAIAQADVLGILGREGVFAACQWPMERDESFIAGGLRMFRDFDGHGGAFGDTSVSAATADRAATSLYASLDSHDSSRLVLVALNKTDRPLNATIAIAHWRPIKTGSAHQLTAASAQPQAAKIRPEIHGDRVSIELPPMSVSTINLGS